MRVCIVGSGGFIRREFLKEMKGSRGIFQGKFYIGSRKRIPWHNLKRCEKLGLKRQIFSTESKEQR